MTYYTYIHYRGDNNEPFYVGKGSKDRAWQTHPSRGRNRYWTHIVNKHGFTVKIVNTFNDEWIAYSDEIILINSMRIAGHKLTNIAPGGGIMGSYSYWKGKHRSQETKDKLADAFRGIKRPNITESNKRRKGIKNSGWSKEDKLKRCGAGNPAFGKYKQSEADVLWAKTADVAEVMIKFNVTRGQARTIRKLYDKRYGQKC